MSIHPLDQVGAKRLPAMSARDEHLVPKGNPMTNDTLRAVAWRVKDFSDDWIYFRTKKAAEAQAEESGAAIEALYAAPEVNKTLAVAGETIMKLDMLIVRKDVRMDQYEKALAVISNASERSETMFGGKMSEVTRVFESITRAARAALKETTNAAG